MIRFFLNDWIINYLEKAKFECSPEDEILFYAALCIYFVFLYTMSMLMIWCGKEIKKHYKNERKKKK